MYVVCIVLALRGVYNHKSGHIDSRERSWCVMVCRDIGRPTYAFASSHHPFQSLFADFRRFSPLSGHIDFFSLKFTQIHSNFKIQPRTTLFGPFLLMTTQLPHRFFSPKFTQNDKMPLLIEFLSNKNSTEQELQQISAQIKLTR